MELTTIENLVHKSKDQGYVRPHDMYENIRLTGDDIHDIIKKILRDKAKSKLLSYGLIERELVNGVYPLTPRGRHFESFAIEDRNEKRELYMKGNAYWRAKYWWLIGFAGFVIGSILTPILLEEWKTWRQSKATVETIRRNEVKIDTSLHN